MKRLILSLTPALLFALACGGIPDPEGLQHDQPTAGTMDHGLPWTHLEGDLPDELASGAAVAAREGNQAVLYVGATWCGPCKEYKAALTAPRLKAAHAGVRILEADLDADGAALEALGVEVQGVPHWQTLDLDGKPVEHAIDGGAWGENTPENMAPVLTAFFKGER